MIEMCAHCVALVYRNGGILLLDGEHTRRHPGALVRKVLEGHRVEDNNTREVYGLAVTRINGTAVCGWHGYNEMKRWV